MRDIPLFTTQYGTASLALKEIPYRGEAYVTVLSCPEGDVQALAEECARFCRMAGAERVYLREIGPALGLSLHCAVLAMTAQPERREPEACLWPVTQENASHWRKLYNEAMAGVDNAATLEARDEKALYEQAGAYFVHRDGILLGIGWLREGQLLALASARRGMGETVLRSLFTILDRDTVSLEVASTNQRALALYRRLGFLQTGEASRWYRLYPEK